MTTTIELPNGPRLLVQASLSPIQGTRFQPTGFPDVGAGVYTMPDGREQLLVESAQSVANRLEAACWDDATNELLQPLEGLPYVRVNDGEGKLLTTSVQEAHRLNSVYIEKSSFFDEKLRPAIDFDDKKPTDRGKLVAALARYDVNCLLHGVFLESIAGTLRLPRALSGFIEANDVQRVSTGGVKNDRVQPSTEGSDQTAKDGFGNVPFHRTEFVAREITAYFNLDLEQLRSYRLGAEMSALLFALSVFKIQRFLETGLRLRTACDFAAGVLEVKAPTGFKLPSLSELTERLPALIKQAKRHFADPAISTVVYGTGGGSEKKDRRGKKAK